MKNYFKRTYLATMMLATSFVASLLKVMVAHVIELKGLDLNPMPAPPSPEPTVNDLWKGSYIRPRKQFSLPYVPKWVAASLKDPTKHPGFSGRVQYQSTQEGPLEVTTLLATVDVSNSNEIVSELTPNLDVSNESTEIVSSITFNNIH